ncbi:hypothetical protein [Clostridium sp. AF32-12BH]|nr:hypothetical protein [Clostridium sp. AF32-12BH]
MDTPVFLLVVAALSLFLTANYFLQIYSIEQDMIKSSSNLL